MLKGDEVFMAAGKHALQAMRWQPTLANPARQPHTTEVQLDWQGVPVSTHFRTHC